MSKLENMSDFTGNKIGKKSAKGGGSWYVPMLLLMVFWTWNFQLRDSNHMAVPVL